MNNCFLHVSLLVILGVISVDANADSIQAFGDFDAGYVDSNLGTSLKYRFGESEGNFVPTLRMGFMANTDKTVEQESFVHYITFGGGGEWRVWQYGSSSVLVGGSLIFSRASGYYESLGLKYEQDTSKTKLGIAVAVDVGYEWQINEALSLAAELQLGQPIRAAHYETKFYAGPKFNSFAISETLPRSRLGLGLAYKF